LLVNRLKDQKRKMQGYCEKVNFFKNDKIYLSAEDGNLQIYRDSEKIKSIDCVVLTNKTVMEDEGKKSLKLMNIFMKSGNPTPTFVLKFDDANIRSQWRGAIEAACRSASSAHRESAPLRASLSTAPAAAGFQDSSSQKGPQHFMKQMHSSAERIGMLDKKSELLLETRKELNRQLQALCQNGGRNNPANKPKIARIMKDIKSKDEAVKVIDGMRSKLQDKLNMLDSFLTTRNANDDLRIDPQMKSEMSQLSRDLEQNEDDQRDLQAAWDDIVPILSSDQDIDDEELNRQLDEIPNWEIDSLASASSAQGHVPALCLPAAGKKAMPAAAQGRPAQARHDDEDELERLKCLM
jgi:seryl-tRNA synthetase